MRMNELPHGCAGPYWRARLRRVILLLPVAVLMGCSAPMAVTPRIPQPAPELMEPTPTGSEVLQRATQHMETWHKMLLSGQTE